jgi:lipopolysaccharide transport system ATP-binding protein
VSDVAIRAEGLSKRYRIGLRDQRQDTLAGAVLDSLKQPGKNLQRLRRLTRFDGGEGEARDVIWALKDVSFEVRQGEVLGIIGRNGAGKTTLLKVLARITHPTAGRVELRGRVSSLLEVGTGFHPELTGQENIYLNGTILGMKKAEIDQKFDAIVEFSGVEGFLDTPVKRYSSGMRVRLAFSVAAHLEPEILLVDEVLAVGDIEFQNKCLGKMENVAQSGRAVLFVSHNIGAVESLCSRGVMLEQGHLAYDGSVTGAVETYLESMRDMQDDPRKIQADPHKDVVIREVWFEDQHGDRIRTVRTGAPVTIAVCLAAAKAMARTSIHIGVYSMRKGILALLDSGPHCELRFDQGNQVVRCSIDSLCLNRGQYKINVAVFSAGLKVDHAENVARFDVEGIALNHVTATPRHGPLVLQQRWTGPPARGS